ncbi:hypothetical protein M885DRAFT_250860 [Pelagophyceae sp. CCMP2097]|nr:hypothetical protein M885DRAFT_250860 [Pelagophyceae sp. CCMP2097]
MPVEGALRDRGRRRGRRRGRGAGARGVARGREGRALERREIDAFVEDELFTVPERSSEPGAGGRGKFVVLARQPGGASLHHGRRGHAPSRVQIKQKDQLAAGHLGLAREAVAGPVAQRAVPDADALEGAEGGILTIIQARDDHHRRHLECGHPPRAHLRRRGA